TQRNQVVTLRLTRSSSFSRSPA
ncbi:hypothetical protein D046_4150B, partial [Vibrio parahaemolyticus V-223/04]